MHLGATGKGPTIPIAMGEIGVFTRILGAKFGAPFTYAGFNPERVFAAGMPHYMSLKNDFAYNEINADTEIYGVIGDPIEQSLSPVVHNAAFRKLGLNKVMVPFLVPNGELPAFFNELLWLDIKGCSVTIPHKEAIVPLLQQKEGAVERTGSCNTVVFQDDGKRVGYNTDYRAAMDSLEAAMGGRTSEDEPSPLFEKQVLILGAGGVARAIAFGLDASRRDRDDHQSPRRPRRPAGRGSRLPLDQLVDAGQQPGRRDHQRHAGRHAPQRRRHAASRRGVQPGGNGRLRHDLSPGEHHVDQAGAGTRLPDGHRRRHVSPPGRRAVQALYGSGRSHRRDGRGPQTQAFTAPPRMTRDPAPPRPRRPGRGLALVGYRGTGKSTVGRIVAGRSQRTFLDADLELEARAGRSVSAILTEEGEPVFRDWEERTLAELIEQSPTAVIATGGGAVAREVNRRRLRDFGFIVWLTAEPAELACRLQSDPGGLAARPALTADGTIAEIARVLEVRTPLYQEVADAVIETGGKDPDQVAAAILECWSAGP